MKTHGVYREWTVVQKRVIFISINFLFFLRNREPTKIVLIIVPCPIRYFNEFITVLSMWVFFLKNQSQTNDKTISTNNDGRLKLKSYYLLAFRFFFLSVQHSLSKRSTPIWRTPNFKQYEPDKIEKSSISCIFALTHRSHSVLLSNFFHLFTNFARAISFRFDNQKLSIIAWLHISIFVGQSQFLHHFEHHTS